MTACSILAAGCLMGGLTWGQEPLRQAEVIATPPADEKPGEMPYEMRWSMREPHPAPQVVFSDLTGWTLEVVEGDADVKLVASVAQRIWEPQTAQFHFHDGTQRTKVRMRPPAPIKIDGEFDAARAWIFGGWYRRAQSDEKQPEVTVLLKDANGKPLEIALGRVISGNWSIEQGIVEGKDRKAPFPMTFEGIEIDQVDIPKDQGSLWFESLTFYKQDRNPKLHGYHQIDKTFPTSDDGMLPTPPADVKASFEKQDAGAVFTSIAAGKELRYRVDPKKGFLEGIEAQWNGEEWFQPTSEGTLQTGRGSSLAVLKAEFAFSKVDGDRLVATYRAKEPKAIEYTVTYALKGRTLLVDVASKDGEISRLNVGQVAGLKNIRGIFVPYMVWDRVTHLTANGPLIGCGDSAFVSVLPDLYHSDFSSIVNDATEGWKAVDGKLRLMTATEYTPLTDGNRNDLRERLMITVSSEFDDVLPNMRNPVSINRERMAQYFYYLTYFPHLNFYTTMQRYGLDKIIASHHAFACFVAGPGKPYEIMASFSYRWRPIEAIGVEGWRKYGESLKNLGYLFSMYTYYPDLGPASEYWDENKVTLKPDGTLNWGYWYGNYLVKPNDMAKMATEATKLLKDLYAPDGTYLDIHTVMGPAAVDYEAGVDGAGMARMTVLGNTDSISAVRKHMGLTTSEGYHRWLYAGIADADYATLLHGPEHKGSWEVPLLVDFDLRKIQPFGFGTMMGFEPKYYLQEDGDEWRDLYSHDGRGTPPIGYYKYMAASLAYGHMGAIGYDWEPPLSTIIRTYAMMMSVQPEYLTDHAKTISYYDGKQFLPTSDALRHDVVKQGRVRVEYERGLVVQVNYNPESWKVQAAGREFELPPYGWVIEKPGEILSYSTLIDGKRVDAANCNNFIYINSADQPYADEGIEVTGGAWLKREPAGGWRLIPCGDLGVWEKGPPAPPFTPDQYDRKLVKTPDDRGLTRLAIDLGRFDVKTVVMRDASGAESPVQMKQLDNGLTEITLDARAVDYLLK